jgi:hypothetical protein
MSKFTVLPRAAAVVAALAIALPALAQTSQPAAPAGNAPAASTTDKSVTKQTTGEMKSDKGKTHAAKDMKDGDKNADHKQSAQAPASKKTDAAPAKSDSKAQ